MDFISNVWNILIGLVKSFTINDALDVLVVSLLIYSVIKLVRETRAEQLVKGIFIMVIGWVLAYYLNLHMLSAFLDYFFQFSVFALLVVFQPEVRRALEQIGRGGLKKGKDLLFAAVAKDVEEMEQQQRRGINAVVDACANLQKQRMGALIVFERDTKLGDVIDTGTVVEASPSAPLICNIFFNKAPLHDGAMIMRGGTVYAAGCILPLTKSDHISIDLGTRHRAAVGMSEDSDAVVVVVSEETGQISVAVNGDLTRNYTRETLRSELEGLIIPQKNQDYGKKLAGKLPSIRRAKKQ